jgi:hypothetical protein
MSEPTGTALPAHVVVGPGLDPAALADLAEGFRALGLEPTLAPTPRIRGGELTWLVLASLPLSAFLSTFGTKLAEDGYAGLHHLVARIARHGRGSHPHAHALVLEDEISGTLVQLDDDLRDDGYRALVELDLSEHVGVILRYEAASRRWIAVLEQDDAAGSQRTTPDRTQRRQRQPSRGGTARDRRQN